MLLCVTAKCERLYFRPEQVIAITEPVDIPAGWKPIGWHDHYAAQLSISAGGQVVSVAVGHAEWPALKAVLLAEGVQQVTGSLAPA